MLETLSLLAVLKTQCFHSWALVCCHRVRGSLILDIEINIPQSEVGRADSVSRASFSVSLNSTGQSHNITDA